MKYKDYQNNEKGFRSPTGLSGERFKELLSCFEDAHNERFTRYNMSGKYLNNRRSFTIYENGTLPTVADRLFFILLCLKNNPLRAYHAGCFNMDQKHCNGFIHVLCHILESCLHDVGVMPADCREKFSEVLGAMFKDNDELPVLLHNGTEREIPRPVDNDERQENYSGKKKKHTLRNYKNKFE